MTHKCHAQLHFTPYLWHVRSGWSESLRKWIGALPICARNASTPRLVVEGHIGGEVVRERSFRKLNTQTSLQLSSWMFPLRAYCTLQVWRISTHEDDVYISGLQKEDSLCFLLAEAKFEQKCQIMRNCSKKFMSNPKLCSRICLFVCFVFWVSSLTAM